MMTLTMKPCSLSCSPELLGCELFFFSFSFFNSFPHNHPFLSRPSMFEITAEVWSLDKFHGSFVTLRSELLARNVQRRIPPVARLYGDLALLGDPVILWNWKRKGQFFSMNSGNIHPSPTVSPSLYRFWTFAEITNIWNDFSLTASSRFDLFGTIY
jgi:hypothetical protein